MFQLRIGQREEHRSIRQGAGLVAVALNEGQPRQPGQRGVASGFRAVPLRLADLVPLVGPEHKPVKTRRDVDEQLSRRDFHFQPPTIDLHRSQCLGPLRRRSLAGVFAQRALGEHERNPLDPTLLAYRVGNRHVGDRERVERTRIAGPPGWPTSRHRAAAMSAKIISSRPKTRPAGIEGSDARSRFTIGAFPAPTANHAMCRAIARVG